LPFPDNYFDAAVLIGVLEYLPLGVTDAGPVTVQEQCLAEFCRVLRPGGRLLIQTKNRFGWQFLLGGEDHSGIAFAPVLPRWLADILSRRLKGRPYRIVNHSLPGYRRLLRRAGFGDRQFAWPFPGYQFPERVLPFGRGLTNELKGVTSSGAKALVLRALAAVGLLKFVVPHFQIVATKPGTEASLAGCTKGEQPLYSAHGTQQWTGTAAAGTQSSGL
jgi:SAM-dependent methyltransferase